MRGKSWLGVAILVLPLDSSLADLSGSSLHSPPTGVCVLDYYEDLLVRLRHDLAARVGEDDITVKGFQGEEVFTGVTYREMDNRGRIHDTIQAEIVCIRFDPERNNLRLVFMNPVVTNAVGNRSTLPTLVIGIAVPRVRTLNP